MLKIPQTKRTGKFRKRLNLKGEHPIHEALQKYDEIIGISRVRETV